MLTQPARGHALRRRHERRRLSRRGLSVVVVLSLLSITLALSYSLVRTQTTAVLLQSNVARLQQAQAAAESGAMVALRQLHQANWGGVNSTFREDVGPNSWFTVAYTAGDAALSPGDDDYAEYPFRVTVDVAGFGDHETIRGLGHALAAAAHANPRAAWIVEHALAPEIDTPRVAEAGEDGIQDTVPLSASGGVRDRTVGVAVARLKRILRAGLAAGDLLVV